MSDRLTVKKLNTVSKPYKQDYKSKLMTEKYSLLPINPKQLTPVQTALQRLSEKHPDFEIQAVNPIRPLEIEYMSCHHSLGATRATLNTQMPPLRRPAAESNDFNPQTERKWRRTGCDGPSRPSK